LCKAEGIDFPEEKALREKVHSILSSHECYPSCVHGDLWAGNIGWTKDGEPTIFDPAFYYYRPTNIYAAHGYGPVLLAGAEVIDLIKHFSLIIKVTKISTLIVLS
jgi:hypothetical protein